MSNARRAASCTWPRPTQPTLSTYWLRRSPVESVTPGIGDACCLTRLDGRCSVSSTVSIVCVHLRSPLLACYRKILTFCSSIITANITATEMRNTTRALNTRRQAQLQLPKRLSNSFSETSIRRTATAEIARFGRSLILRHISHSRSPILLPVEISRDFLLASIQTYILSCTVSKLSRIIGRMFAFGSGHLSLTRSFGGEPLNFDYKMWPQKPHTSLYCVVETQLDILNRLGVVHECDRRTDRQNWV